MCLKTSLLERARPRSRCSKVCAAWLSSEQRTTSCPSAPRGPVVDGENSRTNCPSAPRAPAVAAARAPRIVSHEKFFLWPNTAEWNRLLSDTWQSVDVADKTSAFSAISGHRVYQAGSSGTLDFHPSVATLLHSCRLPFLFCLFSTFFQLYVVSSFPASSHLFLAPFSLLFASRTYLFFSLLCL